MESVKPTRSIIKEEPHELLVLISHKVHILVKYKLFILMSLGAEEQNWYSHNITSYTSFNVMHSNIWISGLLHSNTNWKKISIDGYLFLLLMAQM
jgi:hypothetical protein